MLHGFSPTRLGLVAVKHYTESGRKYLYLYGALYGLLAVGLLFAEYSSTAASLRDICFFLLLPVSLLGCISLSTGALRDRGRAAIDAMLPATPLERFLFLALHTWLLGFLLPGAVLTACGFITSAGQLGELLWLLLPFHPILLLTAFKVRRSLVKGYAVLVLLAAVAALVAGKLFGWSALAGGAMIPVYGSLVPGLPRAVFYAQVSSQLVVNIGDEIAVPEMLRTLYAVLLVAGLYAAACCALRERRID